MALFQVDTNILNILKRAFKSFQHLIQGSTDRHVPVTTGPNRSEIFENLSVLVWFEPKTGPVGGPIGFGPWIPDLIQGGPNSAYGGDDQRFK